MKGLFQPSLATKSEDLANQAPDFFVLPFTLRLMWIAHRQIYVGAWLLEQNSFVKPLQVSIV